MMSWRRKTLLFLTSQAVTLFGSTFVQMAVIWYVTLLTREGIWVAAFTVASYLPQFLISFIGGVWADRYNRKLLIIGADAGIALITLAMWAVLPGVLDDTRLLSLLLVMSVVRSLGAGIQTPAVNAVLTQLVPAKDLMRWNGINATMQSIMNFAAPAAAGAVLTVSTLGSVLLIDAITAALGIFLFLMVALPKVTPKEQEPILKDVKLGLYYTLHDKMLYGNLLVFGLFIFLAVPSGYLAQLFVSRIYGGTYWYLTAIEVAGFLGMMIGGILMSTWGGFQNRSSTLSLGLVAFGVLGIGMGISGKFMLYLVLIFLYGVPLTMVQTAVTTIIQENVEEAIQGRVFGLLNTMYAGCLPLGMAIFGPVADVIPMRWLMIGCGTITVILGALYRSLFSIIKER